MIKSFKSKALKLYALNGDVSKLQPHHKDRIKEILTALKYSKNPQMMMMPGYKCHLLHPPQAGVYAVWVNGNYRITFRFEGEDVVDVDYVDYH
jgi:proteic killer suppression protein